MRVHDCDDQEQFDSLEPEGDALTAHNMIQTFGPDSEAEARNRGFRPV